MPPRNNINEDGDCNIHHPDIHLDRITAQPEAGQNKGKEK
jgi:hypothetical protein